MIQHIIKTIELLKERVKYNLDIIHSNERQVRHILEEPVSQDRSRRLEEKYNENKELLKENNDSIQLQLQLTKYLENYRNVLETEEIREYKEESSYAKSENGGPSFSKEEYFEMTINGEINFTEKHPFFDDEEFFHELMEYYKSIEDYETCSILLKRRKKREH